MHHFVPLLVILCLSMHACHIDARNLRLGREETIRNVHSIEKATTRSFLSDEVQAQKQIDRMRTVNCKNAIPPKNLDVLSKKENTQGQRAASGYETTISTIKGNSDQAIKTKATGKQERSMLGAAQQNSDEELVDGQHNKIGDIAEMDYAQPHRKPPIHNEKP